MTGSGRYFRLLGSFAKFGLINEMAFRSNFLIKLLVEVVWLAMMLVFYGTVFRQTNDIAGWTQWQFLCFLGCYFALEGVIETFFLVNCNEFTNLVRNGDLDLYLLKPIDEQFLVSCRKVDWSTMPNFLMGMGLIVIGLSHLGWPVEWKHLVLFPVFFLCGVALAYSFLLMLMSTAVWLIRNQSLMELWWLCTTLMRYPRKIFQGPVGDPMKWIFTFILPILLVVNIPAETITDKLQSTEALLTSLAAILIATVVLLWISRRFFRFALQSYRSASS